MLSVYSEITNVSFTVIYVFLFAKLFINLTYSLVVFAGVPAPNISFSAAPAATAAPVVDDWTTPVGADDWAQDWSNNASQW